MSRKLKVTEMERGKNLKGEMKLIRREREERDVKIALTFRLRPPEIIMMSGECNDMKHVLLMQSRVNKLCLAHFSNYFVKNKLF